MRLELDREDLKTERIDVNCSQTAFDDFKGEVQKAIKTVGKATFYEYRGSKNENYNVIYPPKTERSISLNHSCCIVA